MPLTLVCGGGFGDEGKGKISAYLAISDSPILSVRTGSINAGHTVVHKGRRFKVRQLPSAFLNPSTRLAVAAGALLRLDVFFSEVKELGVSSRVVVDRSAGVIEPRHVEAERRDEVLAGIGSTAQGVGAAMADRVMRRLRLAWEYGELAPYLGNVADLVEEALDEQGLVMVEGTQGLYLSLYHGTYPYVTSRDTSAAAILSEVGVGPRRVDDVVVVFKAYLTRVGGGPLPGELEVEEAAKLGMLEKATVTGRVRRAAPFNVEMARRAVRVNTATQVAITKLDVLFPGAAGARRWQDLPPETRKWVDWVEDQLGAPVTLLGTGEEATHTVDLRREKLGPL